MMNRGHLYATTAPLLRSTGNDAYSAREGVGGYVSECGGDRHRLGKPFRRGAAGLTRSIGERILELLVMVEHMKMTFGVLVAMSTMSAITSEAGAVAIQVLASQAGAKLDSDLLKGGGTDDTAALQRILDLAVGGSSTTLIIDGPALVSGLSVGSNTTVQCIRSGGLYLKDRSVRPIIQNKNRSKDEVLDSNITISGCFLNGNRNQQINTAVPNDPKTIDNEQNKESDGEWISGIRFYGVRKLSITDITIFNYRSFAAHIRNGSQLVIRNVDIDNGWDASVAGSADYINTDGINLHGPIRGALIENVTLRTGDDVIALNAGYDLTSKTVFSPGPKPGSYSIQDVIVRNVILRDATQGFRFLSYGGSEIDRVTIENVTGTIRSGWLMLFGQDFTRVNHEGRIGRIQVSNVSVDRAKDPLAGTPKGWDKQDWAKNVGWFNIVYAGDFNFGEIPLININAPAEQIIFRNFRTAANDSRPIVRLGPAADVDHLEMDSQVIDLCQCVNPYEMDKAARIRSFEVKMAVTRK